MENIKLEKVFRKNTTKCKHYNFDLTSAVRYASSYEQRSDDCVCDLCGAEGTRKKLEKDVPKLSDSQKQAISNRM